MPAPAMRVGAMALLLGAAAAFSPAYLPHLTRVHAASNTCLAKMISVPPLRGESLAATNLGRGSQRKASLVPINQMPAFTNKWADPNYDPTKEEIATKVPLQIAAFKGDVEQVKKLLAEGADVNEQDDSKWTALQWAARGAGKGQNSERATEVMQLLKEAGADLLSENATGNTALHHAAHWGDAKATALLISWYTKEQVDQKTKLGWSALHWAGKAGAAEAAKLLLEAGADPNAQNKKGNTPLHEAAQQDSPEVLEVLVAGGADPTIVNNEKEVPLFNTAYLNFYASTEMLLKGGADPNVIDVEGNAPLMMASRAGNQEIVELLLEYKADVNQVNKAGLTALHEVCARRMSWGTEREDLTALFIKKGADVNKISSAGETPLHAATRVAIMRDDADVMEILLEAGAEKNAKDADGKTALDIAIEGMDEEDQEDSEVLEVLKKYS